MILTSVLVGAVWGLLACAVNYCLLQSAVKKSTANAVSNASLARVAVDAAALGVVFLLRNTLPIDFAAAILSTAVVLSLGGIVSAFLLVKKH